MSEKNTLSDDASDASKIIDAIKELTDQMKKIVESHEKMRLEFKKWNTAGKF